MAKKIDVLHSEAIVLKYLKSGLYKPFDSLMSPQLANEIVSLKQDNYFMPFPFIFTPDGKENAKTIEEAELGETIEIFIEGKKEGHINLEAKYEVDALKRVEQIYGTRDASHPGVQKNMENMGKYALIGEYEIENSTLEANKEAIASAQKRLAAKSTAALIMAANPLHRAHEKVINMALEGSDLLVLFLLKPLNEVGGIPFEVRKKCLEKYVHEFLPKERVLIIPMELAYTYAGHNEVILESIIAKNYGCNRIYLGLHQAGIGTFSSQELNQSMISQVKKTGLEVFVLPHYFYCNKCKNIVSNKTCKHGSHRHLKFHQFSLVKLFQKGLIPPTVLVRKEISAIILANLHKGRIENPEELFFNMFAFSGIIEHYDEEKFYNELISLYTQNVLE